MPPRQFYIKILYLLAIIDSRFEDYVINRFQRKLSTNNSLALTQSNWSCPQATIHWRCSQFALWKWGRRCSTVKIVNMRTRTEATTSQSVNQGITFFCKLVDARSQAQEDVSSINSVQNSIYLADTLTNVWCINGIRLLIDATQVCWFQIWTMHTHCRNGQRGGRAIGLLSGCVETLTTRL